MIHVELDSILEKISESDLESFLVSKQTNVRYLTGFDGDYGYAVVGPQEPVLFTSTLYSEHAHSTVRKPFKVIEIKDDPVKTFAGLGVAFWGKRVGFEAETMTCAEFDKLKSSLEGIELVSTKNVVEELRMVKCAGEIGAITRAQRISERVFGEILEYMREGVEERDLANEIDYRFRKHGGERPAFDTIVAFGANSSKPHAVPSRKKLEPGDIVLFDMGTVCDGYASDMTRTVVFGMADAKVKEMYGIVCEAQKRALEGIKSGLKCSEADKLARDVIEKAGYADRFVHTLGHGVGLEVHEIPRLSHRSDYVLKRNMVVTVEPGIYIPGWGGIRIEDMAVVTGKGCKNLTKASKTLHEIS